MDWQGFLIIGLCGLTVFGLVWIVSGFAQSAVLTPWREVCERFIRWPVRERYTIELQHANLTQWQATDLWALRWLMSLCMALLATVLHASWVSSTIGFGLGWMLIGVWIKQRISRHQRALTLQLPAFLDLLSMCLAAGMNLQTGVQLVLGYQGKTELAMLWRQWLLQVKAGNARVAAFQLMLARVSSPALRRICVALIQAEQSGAGMAASLHVHSQQLRQERLMNAEKQALQAPVKMLLPLVVCFFPSTFLVLGFSIYINMGALFD
jgi:tight adherence protein C